MFLRRIAGRSGAFEVSLAGYLWPLVSKDAPDVGAWVEEANFRYPTSVEAARLQ